MSPAERRRRRSGGFGLVGSLFVLVVLAVAAVALVDLGSVQRRTALMSLQTVRARAAARTGLQWGMQQALSTGACFAPSTLSPGHGLGGFQVRVTCASSAHVEGITTSTVFEIDAEAEYGSFGQLDYVRRRMRAAAHDSS